MNKIMSSLFTTTQLITAKIEEIENDYYILKNDQLSLKAKKAVSCMFEPSIGDKVMACQYDEDIYIVSLLESINPTTVNIMAYDINLNAQNSINFFSQKATVVIDKVNFLTKLLSLKSQTITLISSTYSAIVDTLTLKNKSLHHVVDGHVENQMKSSRRIVKGSDIHQVQESITISKGEIKIDAPQINMG
jgi:protease II